jgi:hypothetical protein
VRPIVRSSLALPLVLLVLAVPAAWVLISPAAAAVLAALTVLEIAMAADSSVPMAGIASRIQHPARRVFLSVGLVVGVLTMRLLLPPAAVAVTQAESPADAAAEAILEPGLFAMHLAAARPGIAAFGAVFIWLVFSEYLFNTDRLSRRAWLGRAEAALADVRFPRAIALGLGLVGAAAATALGAPEERLTVAVGSLVGIAAYLITKLIAAWAKREPDVGWRLHLHAATVVFERGLTVFMLFEILDGAYTLSTPSPESGLGYLEQAAVASVGVGIGAVFLARLTATVDAGQGLKRLRYLKAGAAYVLGVLSVLLWASLAVPIPAAVAGWFGSLIIGLALLSSLPSRRILRLSRWSRMGNSTK